MKFPEQFRFADAQHGYETKPGDQFGAFRIPGREANGRELFVIACDGEEYGWEHVSVSIPDQKTKCPSWEEMCIVKSLFWNDEEAIIQFHPPKSEYVNAHAGCLHLWKQSNIEFPLPPSILVGPKT